MNWNDALTRLAWAAAISLAALISGCSSQNAADPQAAALAQERERLTAENQELAQARTEHEEVQQLKKENQELPRLRNQYQEAARLRKDNDQLRQQLAKLAPRNPAAGQDRAAAAVPLPAAGADSDASKPAVPDENAINEGDEILIEPKHLKALLPDLDFEKLARKEPLSIRSILEKDGVVITNVGQLKEFGLTNWIIQRAPITNPPAAGAAQP